MMKAVYDVRYRRGYRRELWDQGLCIDCKGDNSGSMRLRCRQCSARNVKRAQASRARRVGHG